MGLLLQYHLCSVVMGAARVFVVDTMAIRQEIEIDSLAKKIFTASVCSLYYPGFDAAHCSKTKHIIPIA